MQKKIGVVCSLGFLYHNLAMAQFLAAATCMGKGMLIFAYTYCTLMYAVINIIVTIIFLIKKTYTSARITNIHVFLTRCYAGFGILLALFDFPTNNVADSSVVFFVIIYYTLYGWLFTKLPQASHAKHSSNGCTKSDTSNIGGDGI